jgi:hypothetical protein
MGQYKKDIIPSVKPRYSLRSILIVMVPVWFFVRAVVLVGCAYGAKLPLLGEATAEDLALGLERGDFTSVELVKVCLGLSWRC